MLSVKMMFPKALAVKSLAHSLAQIIDEAPIFVSEKGISVRSLSEDKTVMLVLSVPPDSFESLEVERPLGFKVSTRELLRVVRRALRGDSLELSLDISEKRLKLTFVNKKSSVSRSFELPVSLEAGEMLGEPRVDVQVKFGIKAKDLKVLLQEAKLVAEEITLEYSNNSVVLRAEEADVLYEAELRLGEPLTDLSSTVDEARASYAVKLIASTLRAASPQTVMTFGFGTAQPARISFELVGGGEARYWIAPRV
ncbi:MAG: hypothetical protein QXU97_01465 [Fervidicoccaceae archaeon]